MLMLLARGPHSEKHWRRAILRREQLCAVGNHHLEQPGDGTAAQRGRGIWAGQQPCGNCTILLHKPEVCWEWENKPERAAEASVSLGESQVFAVAKKEGNLEAVERGTIPR